MPLGCLGGTGVKRDSASSPTTTLEGCTFAFAGGGFLIPYYTGVIDVLTSHGVLTPNSLVSGSSSGALTCACISCGLSVDDMSKAVWSLTNELRQQPKVAGLLGKFLRQHLQTVIPQDAHLKCNGKLHVCVTCVRSGAKGGRFLKTEYISQFESREDLIDALCASSHLPWYSAASFSCAFRGKRYVDGGMTRLVPEPPRPPAVRGSTVGTVGGTAVGAGSTAGKGSATGGGAGREAQGPVPLGVKISCMPEAYLRRMMLFNKKQVLANVAIAPGTFSSWDVSMTDMIRWSFRPGPDEFMQRLEAQGRSDATTWLERLGAAQRVPLTVQPAAAPGAAAVAAVASGSATAAAAVTAEPPPMEPVGSI